MNSRRAQSMAGDLYEHSALDRLPEWQVPHEPDDRSYMMLMYQEHAELARQQEYLRALWSAVLVALGAVLLLWVREDERQWITGATLVAVGSLGALALAKHYARYKLHVSVMRSFRMALAETVRADISRLSTAVRLQHDRNNRLLGFVSLHGVFLLLAFAMVCGGTEMIWRSVEAGATNVPELAMTAGAGATRKAAVALAPGSEQP